VKPIIAVCRNLYGYEAGARQYLPELLRDLHARRPGLLPEPDHLHHAQSLEDPRHRRAGANPQEDLDFLDSSDTETVVFMLNATGCAKVVNADYAIAVARAVNDWVHDHYLKFSPRFKALALLPLQRPEAAVEELRHAVKDLGMLGALLPSNGLKGLLGSYEYWPVYEAAEKLGCCLAIRGANHWGLGFDDLNVYAPAHALGHPYGLLNSLASILYNGIFDRYPGVRIGFLEGGVAWMLMAMERFDMAHEDYRPYDLSGELLRLKGGERVSDYIVRQMREGRIFFSCSGSEPLLAQAVRVCGVEPFLYQEFAHRMTAEVTKGLTLEMLNREDLTPVERETIVYVNPRRFYNLPA
jgi:predicted TIM-barrel fold metal-dependent hydrolase